MLRETDLSISLQKRSLSQRDATLLILAVAVESPKDVHEVKRLGRHSGLPEIIRWNISDILGKERGLAIRLAQGWCLTSEGRKHVKALGVIPGKKSARVVTAAEDLRTAASKIGDSNTGRFLAEAIACFENSLHRACVVLSWVGAVGLLYNQVITKHLASFNAEAQRRDPKWKAAQTADDLARMKEGDFLDVIATPPLSIIGKNVKEELKNNCLQLRNACGHPSSLIIGENKVAAHLEILILNVFTRFS